MTIYERLQANRERILQTAAKYGAYKFQLVCEFYQLEQRQAQ